MSGWFLLLGFPGEGYPEGSTFDRTISTKRLLNNVQRRGRTCPYSGRVVPCGSHISASAGSRLVVGCRTQLDLPIPVWGVSGDSVGRANTTVMVAFVLGERSWCR